MHARIKFAADKIALKYQFFGNQRHLLLRATRVIESGGIWGPHSKHMVQDKNIDKD